MDKLWQLIPDPQIEFAKKGSARPNIEYLVGDDQSFPGEDYDFVIFRKCRFTGLKTRDESCLKMNTRSRKWHACFVTFNGQKGS